MGTPGARQVADAHREAAATLAKAEQIRAATATAERERAEQVCLSRAVGRAFFRSRFHSASSTVYSVDRFEACAGVLRTVSEGFSGCPLPLIGVVQGSPLGREIDVSTPCVQDR